MNKFLAFCLAAAGLASLPLRAATAQEAPACVAVAPVKALPATARINATVFVSVHGRRHHRHYRRVRRVYYRHGVRHVVYRTVYY